VISRNLAELTPAAGTEKNIPLKNHTIMLPVNKLYDLSMVQSVSGGDESFIKKMVALFIETVPQKPG